MSLCKIGDVTINVINDERIELVNDVTDRPVENIGTVTDHVNPRPLVTRLGGVVTGEDAFQKLQTLREYFRKKTIVQYVGRNIVTRVVIEAITTDHNNTNSQGFNFDLSLKQIKIAKVETVEIQAPDPAIPRTQPTSTQSKDISDKGSQPTKPKEIDINALINSLPSNDADRPSIGSFLSSPFGVGIPYPPIRKQVIEGWTGVGN